MASVVVTTQALQFNSIRWGNLGKSAVLILEILLEGPHRRKELRRDWVLAGGSQRHPEEVEGRGLIKSKSGVYSLVEDFDKRIVPFLEENSEDIKQMKKVHERDRKDYSLRLEAWRRAHEDEAEIQRTAEEAQGIYYLRVMSHEAIYNRLRLRMDDHYQQLRYRIGRSTRRSRAG